MVRRIFPLGLILSLGILPNLSAMQVTCKNRLYIENVSGWNINIWRYFTDGTVSETDMGSAKTFKLIGCLEQLGNLTLQRPGKFFGMERQKVSLDEQLVELKRQSGSHKHKDAIITIDATMTNWKFSARWESAIQGSLVMPEELFEDTAESETPNLPTTTQSAEEYEKVSLDEIRTGALGTGYAAKVQEIMDANYKAAEAAGKPNLKAQLEKEFTKIATGPVKKGDKQVAGRIIQTPGKKVSAESARNKIDMIYRVLQKHKAAGLVK